jgi:hypothetical protein
MATVHDGYADVDGQRLFYRETGPAVVLLYGFPSSSFVFRELIPLLGGRYHVIAPDHLGSGLSDAPPASEFTYTFDALADLTGDGVGQLGVTWPEVAHVSGYVSFEPDKIEVSLDRTRLRLEPGQSVVPHGVDRDLITGEVAPGRKP